MGSFKANGREQGPNRRRNVKSSKRRGLPRLESLEERQLLQHGLDADLDGPGRPCATGPWPTWESQLINVYQTYHHQHADGAALAGQVPPLRVQEQLGPRGHHGAGGGRFRHVQAALQNLGMQIIDTSASYGLVDGWLPVSQLPTAAAAPGDAQRPGGHQARCTLGAAINEARQRDVRQRRQPGHGVTGAGQSVGVLSDSFNTWGLRHRRVDRRPAEPNINIIQEGPAVEDEGRGMAQNIYHIAPGAALSLRHRIRNGASRSARTSWPWPMPAPTSSWMTFLRQRSVLPARVHHPGHRHGTAKGVSYFSSAANSPTTAISRTSAAPTAPSRAWAPAGT